jgi:hypothetical protein
MLCALFVRFFLFSFIIISYVSLLLFVFRPLWSESSSMEEQLMENYVAEVITVSKQQQSDALQLILDQLKIVVDLNSATIIAGMFSFCFMLCFCVFLFIFYFLSLFFANRCLTSKKSICESKIRIFVWGW